MMPYALFLANRKDIVLVILDKCQKWNQSSILSQTCSCYVMQVKISNLKINLQVSILLSHPCKGEGGACSVLMQKCPLVVTAMAKDVSSTKSPSSSHWLLLVPYSPNLNIALPHHLKQFLRDKKTEATFKYNKHLYAGNNRCLNLEIVDSLSSHYF